MSLKKYSFTFAGNTINLNSGTADNAGTGFTKINLLLTESIHNLIEQIHESSKDDPVNDGKNQTSAAESSADTAGSSPEESQDQSPGCIEARILYYINKMRTQKGLQVLNSNQALINVACSRSLDMVNKNYFSHYTPEGKSVTDILRENGMIYAFAGENLFECAPPSAGTPETIINTWLNGSIHRANIFNPNYSRVGIGAVDKGNRRVAAIVFSN